jgi:hypothetical protein
MTKQEMYQARIEALQQKAEKFRDFVRETVVELREDMKAHLASFPPEQETAQENKAKELV